LLDDIQNILANEDNENRINEAMDSLRGIQEEIQNLHNQANDSNDEDIEENVENSNDEDSDNDETKNNENDQFPLDLSVNMDNLKKALELTSCEDSSKNIIFCLGSGVKSLFIGMKDNLNNDTRNLLGWKGWRRLKNPLNLTVKNIVDKAKIFKKLSNNSENNESGDSLRDAEFDINFEELKNNYLGVKSLIKSTQSDYDKKEKEIKKIKESTDIDFGPQSVFRTLYNKCYDVEASG